MIRISIGMSRNFGFSMSKTMITLPVEGISRNIHCATDLANTM